MRKVSKCLTCGTSLNRNRGHCGRPRRARTQVNLSGRDARPFKQTRWWLPDATACILAHRQFQSDHKTESYLAPLRQSSLEYFARWRSSKKSRILSMADHPPKQDPSWPGQTDSEGLHKICINLWSKGPNYTKQKSCERYCLYLSYYCKLLPTCCASLSEKKS